MDVINETTNGVAKDDVKTENKGGNFNDTLKHSAVETLNQNISVDDIKKEVDYDYNTNACVVANSVNKISLKEDVKEEPGVKETNLLESIKTEDYGNSKDKSDGNEVANRSKTIDVPEADKKKTHIEVFLLLFY